MIAENHWTRSVEFIIQANHRLYQLDEMSSVPTLRANCILMCDAISLFGRINVVADALG